MPEEGYTNEVRDLFEGVAAGQISGEPFYQNFVSNEPDESILKRPLIMQSPYKGLEKFELEDKDKFFGRDVLITRLNWDLEQNNLIVLLGVSGSGKSSLVRAGIIPTFLDKKFINLTFVPDENPFESLYLCLSSQYGQEKAEIARQVGTDTLIRVLEALKEDYHWLIFIDQFEELFTRTPQEKCDKFIDSLVQLIAARNDSLKIILTMRADFCDRFSLYPNLAAATEQHIRFITDMSRGKLRLAIAEGAARNGVIFEEGLVEQIINDFKRQVNSLPLLQYTLNLLWQKEDIANRKLTKKTYNDLGGVAGALPKQVEKIYAELPEAEKEAVKKIFLELVDIVDNKTVSKRTEQAQFKDSGVLEKTLNQLIDEHLVIAGKQKSTVEIAHEALITAWPKLPTWIKEKEKNEQIRKLELELIESRLQEKAARVLYLLPTEPLNSLLLAIQTIGENLDKLPKQILDSVQTSLHKAMVKTRVPTLFRGHESEVTSVACSPNGLMIVSGSSDYTVRLWDIQGNPIGEPFYGHESEVTSVAFSPCGQMIASGSWDNTVRLWDIQGNLLGEPLRGHESGVLSVAFSPCGQMLASGSWDNTVRLWDIRGNLIGEPLRGHESGVYCVAFSPCGQMLATSSDDRTVRLWNIQGNLIGKPLRGHESGVFSVTFSPDGQTLASGSWDKTIRLWDIEGNPIGEPLRGHESRVFAVAFSPDGQTLASGSWDKTIRLWNIQNNSISEALHGHESGVFAVAFSPCGQMIASGSWDNTI
ncbi:MAG: hypothetical protein N2235_23605, partial [Fischerella sp.]|nr:hypothetical protein [Fischerella sp.]